MGMDHQLDEAETVEATHHKTRPKRSMRPSWPTEVGSMGQLQCSAGSEDSAFQAQNPSALEELMPRGAI